MAEITASLVKELRDKTNAGMMDCKAALKESNGDMEAAIDWLRREKRHRGMDAETPGQLLDGGGMRDDGIVGGRTTGGKAEGRSGPQEERTQRSHGAISFHRGK